MLDPCSPCGPGAAGEREVPAWHHIARACEGRTRPQKGLARWIFPWWISMVDFHGVKI